MSAPAGRRRWLFDGARTAAIAYLLVAVGMTFIERWLVYPAPPASWGDWTPPGDDYQDVWIDVPPVRRGGPSRVHGWFFARPEAQHAVLYFHGNGEDVSRQPQLARLIRDRLDAAVLVVDYRVYGRSNGTPCEEGVVADGQAAQRWLADRTGRTPAKVVLIGRSLGGGVAVACAAEQGAAALVLQSTFTSLPDAAAGIYPWLPVRWAMRDRYDSLGRMARYDGPVLVSHGTADKVVPHTHGRLLAEAATGPSRLVLLDGGTHDAPHPPSYWDDLRAFLAEHGRSD